ncbi:shikimate dehydrogenase [Castellaniella sp.]|uniref:shikimate dehydrogenase family protein n=1 Tax=Castellaniella sp. TaxID=1955812 RepID=UPI0035673374
MADPVAQVRTPQVINAWFREHQVDAVLVPMHVPAGDLDAVLDALRRMRNLGGFIVTVPHKTAIAERCDELGPAGQAIGSVNTVRRTADGRLVGEMFDGAGFVSGLQTQGHDLAHKRVLLLGAGGAGSAIAFALAQAGAASVTVANRTPARAHALVERVRKALPQATIEAGAPEPEGHDIIVNATSLGMRAEDALPLDVERLAPDMLVAEIIMKPEQTRLLDEAQRRGCPIHHGRHMLDRQVALMTQFLLQGQPEAVN